jgi:hypothetical protein
MRKPAVDLAAEQGGNVETTEPGRVVKHGDVTCIGWEIATRGALVLGWIESPATSPAGA